MQAIENFKGAMGTSEGRKCGKNLNSTTRMRDKERIQGSVVQTVPTMQYELGFTPGADVTPPSLTRSVKVSQKSEPSDITQNGHDSRNGHGAKHPKDVARREGEPKPSRSRRRRSKDRHRSQLNGHNGSPRGTAYLADAARGRGRGRGGPNLPRGGGRGGPRRGGRGGGGGEPNARRAEAAERGVFDDECARPANRGRGRGGAPQNRGRGRGGRGGGQPAHNQPNNQVVLVPNRAAIQEAERIVNHCRRCGMVHGLCDCAPEILQEEKLVPFNQMVGPAAALIARIEDADGKHADRERIIDLAEEYGFNPDRGAEFNLEGMGGEGAGFDGPNNRGGLEPAPPPEDPIAIAAAAEAKRLRDIALITAAIRTNAEALLDRRNMDSRDDQLVYRRAVFTQAKASDLTKLGVDVYPLVDQIITDAEQRVLRRRKAQATDRAVSGKMMGWWGILRHVFWLSSFPVVKLHGTPMSKVIQYEALPINDIRQPTFAGRVVCGIAQAAIIVIKATLEENYKAAFRARVRPAVGRIAIRGVRKAAEYGLCVLPDSLFKTATKQLVKRSNLLSRLAWGVSGAYFAYGSSFMFAGVECYRTGQTGFSHFFGRLAAHMALTYIGARYGMCAAIALHAIYNIGVIQYGKSHCTLDVTNSVTCGVVVPDLCTEFCPMKRVETQDKFVITSQPEARCNQGFGARGLWGVKELYADVFRTCHHNELTSLKARVGKKLPQHAEGADLMIQLEWAKVTELTLPIFVANVKRVTTPIPHSEWVKTFPPAKREMYDELLRNNAVPPKSLQASSFVKKELVLREEEHREQVKDPRMIQGCPPELSLYTGPYIRKAAKALKEGMKPKKWDPARLAENKHFIYTCGMTAEGVGYSFAKAIAMVESICAPGERVVVVEDDQSRFDLHITQFAFKHLDTLYRNLMPVKVANLLRRSERSKGRTALGCKYIIPYTMQSGWPDTSYGDSICNESMKLYVHGPGGKWISIVCGDDSVTITTDREVMRLGGAEGIVAAYAKLGMEVEVVIRENADLAEFCSARFYPCGETYIMMPKPGKVLARSGWDMVDRTPQNQRAWARGVAQTLQYYGLVDPILAALASSLKKQLGCGKVIEDVQSEYKHVVKGSNKFSITRHDQYYYYAIHYGLTASEVDSLEAAIKGGLMTFGSLSSHPILECIAKRDL